MNVLLLILTRPNLLLFGKQAYKEVPRNRVETPVHNESSIEHRISEQRGSEEKGRAKHRRGPGGEPVMQEERLNLSSDSGWDFPMYVEPFQWPQQPPIAATR